MVFKNIEFFNTQELVPYDGGYMLSRYPERIVKNKKSIGARIAGTSTGAEIRFVTDASGFYITLGGGTVYIMMGDITFMKVVLPEGMKKTIEVRSPIRYGSGNLCKKAMFDKASQSFSSEVWRIYSDGEVPLTFYDLMPFGETFVRPPKEEELPDKKMVIYGSSITHWCKAYDSRNSYAYRAGKLLGADVLNKGMAGSCEIDKESIDYIVSLNADIVFLELGINVISHISAEEFEKRVKYAFEAMPKDKRIYATGMYDCYITLDENHPLSEKFKIFNGIVLNLSKEYGHINYIDPKKILDSPTYLSDDMIHPTDFGHIQMSQNLFNEIKKSEQ